ncbi:hypothetical protein H8959_018976, partial [Pygathrix nigripes]
MSHHWTQGKVPLLGFSGTCGLGCAGVASLISTMAALPFLFLPFSPSPIVHLLCARDLTWIISLGDRHGLSNMPGWTWLKRHYDPPAKSPEIKLLGHKRWRLKFQDSTYSCHKSFQNARPPTPSPTASPRETRVPKCPSEKNGEARPKVIRQWASTQAFTRSDPDSQTVQGLLLTWSHLVPVPALPLCSESENLICALRRRLVVLLTKSWTGDLVIDPKTIITNPFHIQERDQMHSLLKVAKNMAGLYGFAIRCFHCSMCSALKSSLTRERGPLPSTGSDSEGCIMAVFHGNRFQEEHHRRSAGSEDFQSAPKLSQTKRRVAGFTASAGTKGRGYD